MVGNLIAAVVLGHLAQYFYAVVISVIALVGIIGLFFLRTPRVNHHSYSRDFEEVARLKL